MTSLIVERIDLPDSSRGKHALAAARSRVADILAGRRIAAAASDPRRRDAAAALCRWCEETEWGVARLSLLASQAEDEIFGSDDVFVAHDAATASTLAAAREGGAHAVRRLPAGAATGGSTMPEEDPSSVSIACIDAYLLNWRERAPSGDVVECVAAAMPAAGLLAAKKYAAGLATEEPRRLAWRMAIAEIVRGDRDEAVGGTLGARPAVPAR